MFKGIQKVTLIDYPGKVACTVFTGGCNFRCPWCHNWGLVEPAEVAKSPEISENSVKNYLISRKGKLQGVCITGGEPTLWKNRLAEFMLWCKENSFLVKLDTNGSCPGTLQTYLNQNLVDFVAMDIKNIPGLYARTTGLEKVDTASVFESIQIIRRSGINYQFRTTIVPDLVDRKKMQILENEIGEAIVYQDYRKPVLQN